mgnify:CR=1 FL=1
MVIKKIMNANIIINKAYLFFAIILVISIGVVFLLNKIDFPAPKKEIEKVIPNENFKVIK